MEDDVETIDLSSFTEFGHGHRGENKRQHDAKHFRTKQ